MSKIRKLYYFDKKSTEEMISLLNNSSDDLYLNQILFNPLILLHHLLPLRLKFMPESYIIKDNKDAKGLITVVPIRSNPNKVEIQKLLFEENALTNAAELVQYVVSRYKAMGAASIIVKVDDYLSDLLNMFVSQCGFSQISNEKLWRITNFPDTQYDKKYFRSFKNQDSNAVAEIYNNTLLPHFRPLLSNSKIEFQEDIFKGLSYFTEYKYVIEEPETKNIIGYLSIKTSDNENFILDIIHSGWNNLDINSLIHYTVDRIKKRKNRFGLFIKSKQYTNSGNQLEKFLNDNHHECVQNQIVLTNSSARVLKDPEKAGKYTILNNFIPSNGIPT